MFLHLMAAAWLLAVSADAARAQQAAPPPVPSGPLTLEQVLQLTEPRSEAMAIAQEGVKRAEGEQIRARSGRYPQLTLSAGYDRALASEFEGVFDVSSGPSCAPFTLKPTAAIDARVTEI